MHSQSGPTKVHQQSISKKEQRQQRRSRGASESGLARGPAAPFPAPWQGAGELFSPFTGPWILPAVDICSSLLELLGATLSRYLWVFSTALLCPRFPNSDQEHNKAKLHPFPGWQHNFYQLYMPSIQTKDPFLHVHMRLHFSSQLWTQFSSHDSSCTGSS